MMMSMISMIMNIHDVWNGDINDLYDALDFDENVHDDIFNAHDDDDVYDNNDNDDGKWWWWW